MEVSSPSSGGDNEIIVEDGIDNSDIPGGGDAMRDEFCCKKHESGLFLMKALTLSKVSNTALDILIGDISDLLESRVNHLRSELFAVLQQRGVEFDGELTDCFQNEYLLEPFHGLETVYLRNTFYEEEMGLLVGTLIILHVHIGARRALKAKADPEF